MNCNACGAPLASAENICVNCGKSVAAPDATVPDATQRWAPSVAALGNAAGVADAAGPPPYAGFGQRVAAVIIDAIAMYIVQFALGFAVVGAGATGTAVTMLVPFGSVISWLYKALMESSSRQATLGKLALGIKVTDYQGQRIGFGRASGRFFAQIVSSLTLCIGFLMATFTARRQTLHDLVASTLVVRSEAEPIEVARAGAAAPMSALGVIAVVLLGLVVPGIGILAAIAIPAYQDYTLRAQVAQGLSLAGSVKAAVAASYSQAGTVPADRVAAGLLGDPAASHGDYVGAIKVVDGRIDITFDNKANRILINETLSLTPYETANHELVWRCGTAPIPESDGVALAPLGAAAGGIAAAYRAGSLVDVAQGKYLPRSCRSQ